MPEAPIRRNPTEGWTLALTPGERIQGVEQDGIPYLYIPVSHVYGDRSFVTNGLWLPERDVRKLDAELHDALGDTPAARGATLVRPHL
uniref:Uncharacterized protein n=1 Tax=Streptomyces sp. NBC_00003 TaxID=2903608 RepID=A0AAU2V7V6_9ACTN